MPVEQLYTNDEFTTQLNPDMRNPCVVFTVLLFHVGLEYDESARLLLRSVTKINPTKGCFRL